MKTFKQYVNNKDAQGAQGEYVPTDAERLTKQIAAAYNGKSNADMWRNIIAEAEKSRRAGTLSDEEIDAFYLAFSPMLDSAQHKKLKAIVEKLKKM